MVTLLLVVFAPEPEQGAEGLLAEPATPAGLSPLLGWPQRPALEPLPERDAPSASLRDGDVLMLHNADGVRGGGASQAASVPPLPFRFIGRMVRDGVTTLFLAEANRTHAVAAGERIDGRYLVQRIEDNRIDFVHIATDTRQSLVLDHTDPVRPDPRPAERNRNDF